MTIFETPPEHHDAEALLRRAADLVGTAKSVPLSSSVMISRDEDGRTLQDHAALRPRSRTAPGPGPRADQNG